MALTGLALIGFLVTHLAGNLLVFGGSHVFNNYSHTLTSNPLVPLLELLLLAIFVLHVYKAVTNFAANRAARPVPYQKKVGAGHTSRKSAASSSMIISGLITILFVVLHLKQFKYGPTYFAAGGQRDLYRLEVENFSNPLLVAFYLVSLVVLGLHLWHGFWSAFQSMGIGNARTTPRIMQAARAVGLVLIAGFLVIPVWVYFFGGRP